MSPEDAQAAAQAQARQMVDQMARVAAVMSGADVDTARSRMATELAVQDQVDQALDSAIDLSTHASHPDWGVTLVLGETQLMVRASKAAPQDAQETIDMAHHRVCGRSHELLASSRGSSPVAVDLVRALGAAASNLRHSLYLGDAAQLWAWKDVL